MKKIVIVCGLIAGLIVATVMAITAGMCYSGGSYEGSMLLGYATMIVAFSLVFVGIKNYRDRYNNGAISFGKAFTIGLYITLIASTMYVIAWLIEMYNFFPDFADKYSAHMLDKLKASGASQLKFDETAKEMANFREMYKKPIYVILFTYVEILPVGLIITLISSLILKRKNKPALG